MDDYNDSDDDNNDDELNKFMTISLRKIVFCL